MLYLDLRITAKMYVISKNYLNVEHKISKTELDANDTKVKNTSLVFDKTQLHVTKLTAPLLIPVESSMVSG